MDFNKINHQSVTDKPGESALFIVYNVLDNKDTNKKIKDLCSNFAAIIRSMKGRYPELEISGIIGFGSNVWNKLFPKFDKPKELEVFKEIKGEKHTAPSTKGDLFFHIRAKRVAACYEIASILNEKLSGIVEHIDEVHGFRYFDGRSIIGFVDGTENPENLEALSSAIIGDNDKKFKGGSYAFVQKYLHDMSKWNSLPTNKQEKVIGRRKFNDVELSDDEKPENAHNAVTNIEDEDGNELKIVRANMPFSNPSKNEFGTYFIGYASTFTTTKKMLENMFIGEPIGNYDRLLDFSTAVTGTLFFIPTFDLLEELVEEL
ncbi:Dyp-type peroxidase [Aliarcobacter lanthieri]|uniref:Dyp-type peroxidase n=1 Tax=Aliarcobacter lanthieri TaxID=1355374 RepID=UPI003AAB3B97